MVEETNLEIINRLAQFVLNRQTDDIRNELQDYLISISLLESKGGYTLEEITNFLESKLNVKNFPEKIIRESLDRLEQKKEIFKEGLPNGKNRYLLDNSVEKKLTGFSIEYKTIIDNIFDKLFSEIDKKCRSLTDTEKKQLRYTILLSFGHILKIFGAEVASIFYVGKLSKIESIKFQDFENDLNKRLEKFIAEKLIRNCIIEFIQRLFKNPTMDFSKFLFAISQGYYLIEILNLDPESQKLIKTKLSKKTIYLDTNVVIKLLFGEEKDKKKITKKELDLIKNLNFSIMITKRTLDEFNSWMKEKKKIGVQIQKISLSRFQKSENFLEEGTVKDFFFKKQKQPSLTWDGFLARYEKIEDILRAEFGISVDNTFNEKLKGEEKNVQLLIPIVQHYFYFKSDTVAEHDASNIIFIKKNREGKKIDALGPNCWFLTHDSSLQKVENEYDPETIPSTIYVSTFIQMISPFLAPDISNQDAAVVFARVFGSSIISTHIVNEESWLKIQGPWLDTEGMSSELIEKIIGSTYVRDLLRKKKVDEIEPDEICLAIDKALINKFKEGEKEKQNLAQEKQYLLQEKQDLVQQHTEQIKDLKKQFEKQGGEIQKIKNSQKTHKLDLKKDKRIAFLSSLVLVLGAIIVDLLLYVFLKDFWITKNQIIISAEIAILVPPIGIHQWLRKQILKLEETK